MCDDSDHFEQTHSGGEVDRTTEFERGMPAPHQAWDGTQWRHDAAVIDDQALVINLRGRGLVVVTGCGHAGVVNIARQALRLTGVDRLHALIGGGLYWLVPATIVAILAGLVNTWVLLVEIMR